MAAIVAPNISPLMHVMSLDLCSAEEISEPSFSPFDNAITSIEHGYLFKATNKMHVKA